jgi:UDP-N-acetylmuramate dehydrogenase
MSALFEPRENVPLASFTTFGIGGAARYFFKATREIDVWEAFHWAKERGVPLFVLGGGSNLLVRDSGFEGLVVQVALRGIAEVDDGVLEVAAGEPWDGFVEYAVGRNLAGIECLAGIPGFVGGTPVQNVGAYGQEVSQTVASVRAFDRTTGFFTELTNAECRFRYRESLFNTDEPGRYIVTCVRFRLERDGAPNLRYADLQKRFAGKASPTLAEVAATVREIRREKGMLLVEGDTDCRSAGSFFKNPIVAEGVVARVAAALGMEASQVPNWPAGDGRLKLPAAWLLERAGFTKGYGEGAVGISSRHTLALINRGGATFADVERLQDLIVKTVAERFGIGLEREPVVLG